MPNFALPIVFLLVVLSFRVVASRATVQPLELLFDPIPNFSDEVFDAKFQLSIGKKTLQQSENKPHQSSEPIRVQGSDDFQFTCYIPEQRPSSVTSSAQEAVNPVLPSTFLQELSNKCLLRLEDWWTYEVCYQSQVRQYHKDGDQVTAEFELGHFSGNAAEVDQVLHEDGPVALASPYVREVYTNGTICDIADRHRSVEVRYICSDDEQTSITSVKEMHSCAYQITVATPLICSHPAFKGTEVPLHEIQCFSDVELVPAFHAEEGSNNTSGTDASDSDLGYAEPEGALPEEVAESPKQRLLSMPIQELDIDGVNDLVQYLIQMASDEDPDADFMEDKEKPGSQLRHGEVDDRDEL